MNTPRASHGGFAAIAAVFLVLVLAALGAFMVSFSNTQQLNSARDVQGSRAYWAARAGLEWAVARLGPGSTACWGATAPTPPTTVEGFSVSVSCTPASYTDGATTVYVFRLKSTATAGSSGGVGYVDREVSASLER